MGGWGDYVLVDKQVKDRDDLRMHWQHVCTTFAAN